MVDSDKKILAVDLIKGISIFGVIFIHPIIYGTWSTETNALSIVPFYVVLIFIPIILMGTWGGGFPLISSLTNTYNAYHRLEKGYSYKQIFRPIMSFSAILFVIDPLKAVLVDRTWTNSYLPGINYSIFSHLLEQHTFAPPGREKVFQIGSLPGIALSGFVTCLMVWLLFRKGGKEKTTRNVLILVIIGVIFSIVAEPINTLLNPGIVNLFVSGSDLIDSGSVFLGVLYIFIAYICRIFIGAQLSFVPMGCYAFFGIAGGILLARREPMKKIRLFGYTLGFGYLIAFVITVVLAIINAGGDAEAALFGILDYEIYPKELLFFSLGCMLLIFVGLVKRFEYVSPEMRAKRAKRMLFFRRFGVVTLTLYFFEPVFNQIIAYVFHIAFTGVSGYQFNVPDGFNTNFWAILLFVGTFEGFWILLVWLWSKIGFKFGFEYWIKKISDRTRKIKSKRLILETYEVDPPLRDTSAN
jgi:hypothetical protein